MHVMTGAEYAVAGVVVGALASGSVQSYLARADRRRDARSAARLLYMQLHGARKAVDDLRPRRDWGRMITNWNAYGVAWERYSESLAHTLNTTSFHMVSAAFECIASLALARDRDMDPTSQGAQLKFDPTDGLLAMYIDTIDAAKQILLRHSFRWWEHWARNKAMAS
jgi:hypothetical protein